MTRTLARRPYSVPYQLVGMDRWTQGPSRRREATVWDRGVEATSPNMLLTRSGVGQGSLYHHFGSKAAWAEAAIASLAADLTAETDELFSAHPTAPTTRLPVSRGPRSTGAGWAGSRSTLRCDRTTRSARPSAPTSSTCAPCCGRPCARSARPRHRRRRRGDLRRRAGRLRHVPAERRRRRARAGVRWAARPARHPTRQLGDRNAPRPSGRRRGRPAADGQIGDAVHAALVDAFAIPADDRFQVLRGSSTTASSTTPASRRRPR